MFEKLKNCKVPKNLDQVVSIKNFRFLKKMYYFYVRGILCVYVLLEGIREVRPAEPWKDLGQASIFCYF